MNIKRGQVYYIRRAYDTVGSEQWSGRPGIIVSNDSANSHSRTIEVVYLTTQPKADLPTHVTIRSLARESTALCEQISSVAAERLGDLLGTITDSEMQRLEAAMMDSLGIVPEYTEDLHEDITDLAEDRDRLTRELEAEKAKNTALQWAYEALVEKILRKENDKC